MFNTSQVLGKLVEKYVRTSIDGGRDCRLLIPGLTKEIATQLHEYIRAHVPSEVNCYLVTDDESPNQADGRISAIGLTSRRIGSFIAIINPGQLVHIQDSIRGSGGAIRSMAFSEEWPWIDNGSEAFRFDGPVLDGIIDGWSNDDTEKAWFRSLIIDGLLEYTRTYPRRSQVFLEEIIGSFNVTLYPNIHDTRQKFLYHVGIPRPSGNIPPVEKLIKDSSSLCKKIVERCQKDEDVREQVLDRVHEILPEDKHEEVKVALNNFLDGIGKSTMLDLGLISFHGCWNDNRNDTDGWTNLDVDVLGKLFGIKILKEAKVSCEIHCNRGKVSENQKKFATFLGEPVEFKITCEIPPDDFSGNNWIVQVLNRKNVIVEKIIEAPNENFTLQVDTSVFDGKYSRKIPLRVALLSNNDLNADRKIDLHLCGPMRPAFTVVERIFDVVDATSSRADETPDKKINLKDPVHAFIFYDGDNPVVIRNESGEDIGVLETGMPGIWQSSRRVDIGETPSGQTNWSFDFGELNSVICFEATEIEKGEFTLEDELRVISSSGKREGRLKEIVKIFSGDSSIPYPALGNIGKNSVQRIHLAKIMTNPTGYRPILTNLLEDDKKVSGPLGDYVSCLGAIDEATLVNLTLPPDAISLVTTYSDARNAILKRIESTLDLGGLNLEHPLYATHPIFVKKESARIEHLLCNYLQAYSKIIDYLQTNQKDLEWGQIFVLSHLDCVVQWDKTKLRNAFFLLGPWHPLVVTKRFMIQSELFYRANRLITDKNNGKMFRQLSTLLGSVQGFRWIPGISADDRIVEPAYVCLTSDPGWHVAFKTDFTHLAIQSGIEGLPGISKTLQQNLGLIIETGGSTTQNLAVTAISNYMRAFPSRRSLGIRARKGYSNGEIVMDIDSFLHSEYGATDQGNQLPGGIRLFLEDPLDSDVTARWSSPPLCVYSYQNDDECIRENYPDIYLLSPSNEISFKPSVKKFNLPRGTGPQSVFSQPLSWLTEGQTLVPKSVSFEFEFPRETMDGIEKSYITAIEKVNKILGNPLETISTVDLPKRLDAPWVIIPGSSIDPAILVKYVRDGSDRKLQERALWDYKLDLAGKANSFFILSAIPPEFQVAVNGFFDTKEDVAGQFIVELGRIGIAIGGEALKTGRHALGIIGLVGAVRLLVGESRGGNTPLSQGKEKLGFILPVDSFVSFFGQSDGSNGKRTDLLAIQLTLPEEGQRLLRISACGVESKFVSKTLGIQRAHSALAQAKETVGEFQKLVNISLSTGAMPERLALLNLLRFGLRITSPSKPSDVEQWIETERRVYQAILSGNYEYFESSPQAILVSTEKSLPGSAEQITLNEGLWIRLTKRHWPGIAETAQVDAIRELLCNLFNKQENSGPSPVASGPLPPVISSESQINPITEPIEPRESKDTQKSSKEDEIKSIQKIFIGVDDARRKIYFDAQSPIDPLNNINMMVTGSSGTGKTQFLKYMICKLREQGKNVLVLDLKNDFASDTKFCEKSRMERCFVTFDGLPYNPLIPYPILHPVTGDPYIQCSQHIAGIASVLKQTYGLGAQQQAAVKNAIIAAFNAEGIQTTGSIPFNKDLHFPDFSDVGNSLQNDNPTAYNRLDPLFTLGLFPPGSRTQSFHALVNRSAILDLSQIPSNEIKNALAQLIVLSAHAYYNAQPHSGIIRQVLVFDEGHRVLSSEYIAQLVRECRAYGVGVILSSQYPTDFPGDISASLDTKIIHGNGSDIEKVKNIVQLLNCEGREGDVANLDRFQAFINNRHYPRTLMRTMNYPLYLVWTKLQELGSATREELSQADGIDTTKLPIGNLIHQLERMGLAEEKDGRIVKLD